MKQGNQFYLDFQIVDNENCENILTSEGVKKIVFYIGDLKKTYSKTSEEVTYDEENKCFKVWLTEEETLEFNGLVDLDCRILFDTDEILGCYKSQEYFNPLLIEESILEEEGE